MEGDQHTCIRYDKKGVSIRYILCFCFRGYHLGTEPGCVAGRQRYWWLFDNDQQTIL